MLYYYFRSSISRIWGEKAFKLNRRITQSNTDWTSVDTFEGKIPTTLQNTFTRSTHSTVLFSNYPLIIKRTINSERMNNFLRNFQNVFLHPIFSPSYVESEKLQFPSILSPRNAIRIKNTKNVLRIISLDLDIHHFRRDSRNERTNEACFIHARNTRVARSKGGQREMEIIRDSVACINSVTG